MEFTEIITAFARRHAVEGLVPQDGQTSLDIDGIPVTLVETPDHLVAGAEDAETPAFGTGGFMQV